jgi:antitoxin ParD1/3/4
MSRNTSISLGEHFATFVDAQVESGRYGSVSDVVRAGLRLLEAHETQIRALQEALKAGELSGEPVPFDSDAFLTRMRAKHGVQK